MTVYINGTTGISGVDGSAGTPAVQGADTNTGVFFPAADTVGVSTGGSERVRVDSSGNVGIGTSSPTRLLTLSGSGVNTRIQINNTVSGKNVGLYAADDGSSVINYGSVAALVFSESGTERARIDSNGNVLVTNPAGLGYGTGSGGTVTQATSKSTAVTLNKPTGKITMNNAALAAGAKVTFQLNNSILANTDVLCVSVGSGTAQISNYRASVGFQGTGYAGITVENISAGSLSDALVLNFAIIKGATS